MPEMNRNNLISTNKICYDFLKIKKEELFSLAASAEEYYRPFTIEKREPDGGIKTRHIEPPEKGSYLKVVQRRINTKILAPAIKTLSPNIKGGRKGYSVKENARSHSGSKAIMKFDIKNFFPSITLNHVYKIFRYKLGFTEEAANLLALLTTYQGHLPQGAPTSTSLAILATSKMCERLNDTCLRLGLRSSSWIDDVVISGDKQTLMSNRNKIKRIVADIPYSLNRKKDTGIIVCNSNKDMSITGVRLRENGAICLPRMKKMLRKRIKKAKAFSPSLEGKLRYLEQIEPEYGKVLRHRYYEKLQVGQK